MEHPGLVAVLTLLSTTMVPSLLGWGQSLVCSHLTSFPHLAMSQKALLSSGSRRLASSPPLCTAAIRTDFSSSASWNQRGSTGFGWCSEAGK